ncbi:MAG: YaeQ family protein [Methylobacter sp.]
MALKSTIYKVDCQISDLDRNYYQTHNLTIALHPSETEERMVARLLAFVLHADEQLQFTKGLCADDEPDLWQKSLTGDIKLWIDMGMPDEKRIRKACNRADNVVIYSYGGRNSIWWNQTQPKLERFDNLKVVNLPKPATDPLAAMVQRTMQWQITVQDGQLWISDAQHTVNITPETWLD